ncbi:MAG: TOBE domain-containing protein [Candidatus Helarchaeota archaeon]
MKISARNKLKTTIKKIQVQGLITLLQLSLNEPTIITAVITREAAEEMNIQKGDQIKIIVKPTEIFIQQIKNSEERE